MLALPLSITVVIAIAAVALAAAPAPEEPPDLALPIHVGRFLQQIHEPHTMTEGLPSADVRRIWIDAAGRVTAATTDGIVLHDGGRWVAAAVDTVPPDPVPLDAADRAALEAASSGTALRRAVHRAGAWAVAADSGLYVRDGGSWRLELPREGVVRWAPVDVRGVAYDAAGRLWFAAPHGVGYRAGDGSWRLFTGADGLPFNDFTCIAAGPTDVWFGTTNGAIRFRDGAFSFRQGRRWLLDDHVRDIAVDAAGNAWIATAAGISCLRDVPMTLADKAAVFEAAIEKHHRRTQLGYVNPAVLTAAGDIATAVPVFTDNEGHHTGPYLAACSLAFAASGREPLREHARAAFRALVFLGTVTEGGTHPAPPGFIARAVKPTSEPDPNPQFDLAYDMRRQAADTMWKIIQPRWPVDASGEWYWKNDSSSDEIDGHFLGFATYHDHVCRTDEERAEVRTAVRRIADHLLAHGYNLVDHDGTPTRWARFAPADLNRNGAWCDERGLKCLSILTYLTVAHHLTGDPRYRAAYRELAVDHGYAMNVMTHPKPLPGPRGVGHQPDDNMAFMNYYHLIRYETDPVLLGMYRHAIHQHWQYERLERNPFANFVYAACCLGTTRTDPWGTIHLSPPASCFDDAVDTLRRYPLDLVDWPMSNAHRIDMLPLRDGDGVPTGGGGRRDGQVFPIDERHETYWDLDPWTLRYGGAGLRLREGVPYLLAYALGLAHGFIAPDAP